MKKLRSLLRMTVLTVFLCVFFIFGGCYMPDGTQMQCNMQGCNMQGCNMQGCNMQGCNMQGCTVAPTVNMAGEYKFDSLSYEEAGMLIELKVGEKFMGSITLTEDFMQICLYEDGSAKMVAAGETMNGGSWKKIDDSHVEITFENEPQTFVCDGKSITVEEDGMKLVLKKK